MIKRSGVRKRRQLEFDIVRDQVLRRKEAFIARLSRHLRKRGMCFIFKGTTKRNGYARMNFKYKGQHVSIDVHRVFMILMTRAPIPLAMEAGHEPGCKSRACVRHLRLEHYTENANTNGKEKRARLSARTPF